MYQDMGGYGIVAPDFREVTQWVQKKWTTTNL
jgi:hypothetical protein